MKRHIIIIIFLIAALLSEVATAQSITLRHGDYSTAQFEFRCPALSLDTRQVQGHTFTVATLQGAAPSTQMGAPDLPILAEYIEIPVGADVQVEVSHVQVKGVSAEILSSPLMPVQPAPSKSELGDRPFVIDSVLYATDTFYSHPAAWVDPVGIARDRRLALLRISPVSYNPVTGELQQITSMTVTLTYKGADVAATEKMHRLHHSPSFTWGQRVANTLPAAKEVTCDAPLHYLIVSHSSFRDALDTLINWKKRQGFLVTVVYTDDPEVGTTSGSIAQYIKGFYINATPELPAPTYLLLVGDNEQIPAFTARCGSPAVDHVTDLYYATWTDGDHIPDCYYGRFSARNVDELMPQIEKTVYYESYAFANDRYLGKGVLIAGVDRGASSDNAYRYADPAMDYIASTYIHAGNGYTGVWYYKNNVSFAPTGVAVSGSSQTTASANTLIQLYNNGCGWVNYSAHGYDDSWSQPSFTAANASQMTNNDRPSIMIGNCCLSGKFNTTRYDACLGEALLRKNNNAGAVAYIGGTNSTYWPHDFCWSVGVRNNISNTMNTQYDSDNLGMYDRLFHTHNEPYSEWYNTMGAIVAAGNAAVEAYDNAYSYYYWEIYELFGDPSLMPWLGPAADMNVDAQSRVNISEEHYSITAVPHAYVALVNPDDQTLIAATFADEMGDATLTLPASFSVGQYELVVTAQNYKPYFQQVSFEVFNGPYVVLTDVRPSSGKIFSGQANTFDATIVNVGNQYPTQGLIYLHSDIEGVAIVPPEAHFGAIAPGDTMVLTGLWHTYVPEHIADNTTLTFTAEVNFGEGTSTKNFRMQTTAPRLVLAQAESFPILYSDSTATISCQLVNRGHESTPSLTLMLPNLFGFMTEPPLPQTIAPLEPEQSVTVDFPVSLASDLPNSTLLFSLHAADGQDTFAVGQFHLQAGIGVIEDFETGDLSSFDWFSNSRPWVVTDADSHRGSFSARSAENLPNRADSRLSISWTSPNDDSIRFTYKVSSEENYDKFRFLIDDAERLSASGEVDWTTVSFPVAAGTHTFSFSYAKDNSRYGGSDCAWIDDVYLPFTGADIHFLIDTICQDQSYIFGNEGSVSTEHLGCYHYYDSLSSTHLSLLVTPHPDVHIEVIGTPGIGQCLLLKATGATDYVWSTGDSTQCIAVCPAPGSQYSVTGYRAGCNGSSQITLLGIDSPIAGHPMSVYPNPATDHVTVQADNLRRIWLVNLMGRTVMEAEAHGSMLTLSLQKLPKGVYFMRVETPESLNTEKLILK